MTTLEEKVRDILDSSDFNDLPLAEREKIIKYKSQMQILTLWQILHKYDDVVTPAFRRKVRKWLEGCVDTYQKEYIWAERKEE